MKQSKRRKNESECGLPSSEVGVDVAVTCGEYD